MSARPSGDRRELPGIGQNARLAMAALSLRGAQRRSNPAVRRPAPWIASLTLAMTDHATIAFRAIEAAIGASFRGSARTRASPSRPRHCEERSDEAIHPSGDLLPGLPRTK